ncbi:MAG: hypothetical protein AAGG68_20700 [Bacteroidota bacterium]
MFTKIENHLVPIILVTVACFQIYNSQFGCLDPWKGAGFGMFSTNKESKLNAIGYLSNGDSILIAVMGNKYNVPVSGSLIKTAHRYPKNETVEEIGKQMLKAHYKPDTLKIEPSYVDIFSSKQIERNPLFYRRIYKPKFYQNPVKAQEDKSVKIEKIKILVFQSNFYDEGCIVRKKLMKEVIVDKQV